MAPSLARVYLAGRLISRAADDLTTPWSPEQRRSMTADDETTGARMADARVMNHIRSLLVEPRPVLGDWEYGHKGQQYVCWIVLEDHASKTGIAYCENGFGPTAPWGLIFLEDSSAPGRIRNFWYCFPRSIFRISSTHSLCNDPADPVRRYPSKRTF